MFQSAALESVQVAAALETDGGDEPLDFGAVIKAQLTREKTGSL